MIFKARDKRISQLEHDVAELSERLRVLTSRHESLRELYNGGLSVYHINWIKNMFNEQAEFFSEY